MLNQAVTELRSIKSKYAEAIIDTIVDCFHIPKNQLLRNTQLDKQGFDCPNQAVHLNTFLQVCDNIIEYSGLRHPGLILGQKLNISLLNELGIVLISAKDIWQSLQFVTNKLNEKFSTIQLDLHLDENSGVIELHLYDDTRRLEAFLAEFTFSYIANIIHFLKLPHAEKIAFHFKNRVDISLLQSFHMSNVSFGSENKMILPAQCLHLPSPLADNQTLQFAKQLCSTHDSFIDTEPRVRQKVLNVLNQYEGQLPTLDVVAEQLFSTPWTISRKLKKEQTSFQALVDEVRINRASHLLLHTELKVSDIAQQLGYSDVSSFRRAFKRWFKISPRIFRTQHLIRRQSMDHQRHVLKPDPVDC